MYTFSYWLFFESIQICFCTLYCVSYLLRGMMFHSWPEGCKQNNSRHASSNQNTDPLPPRILNIIKSFKQYVLDHYQVPVLAIRWRQGCKLLDCSHTKIRAQQMKWQQSQPGQHLPTTCNHKVQQGVNLHKKILPLQIN